MDDMLPLSIIVVGASGDLARKKIFPALFSLYSQDFLPLDVNIFGFARSPLDDASFRSRIAEHLTCRYVPGHDCERWQNMFLARCHYVQGRYGDPNAFAALHKSMKAFEKDSPARRLYYLAVPPDVFVEVAQAMRKVGLGGPPSPNCHWCRVIVEKPFGRDRESSDRLAEELSLAFPEQAIYRIDHYLGKEIVQNLLVLRFANVVFEPIWNNRFIEQVQITWKEPFGINERAGYFDQYGIIRDVVQNHLMQLLALLAMDRPAAIESHAMRDAQNSCPARNTAAEKVRPGHRPIHGRPKSTRIP
jgi:glucose-6-phosphate 1-dehydrogenase